MPFLCTFKQKHGRQFCVTDCPASAPCGIFEYVRVERPEDIPAPDPRVIDVPILDMNHGWPNLGHDSLVHAVMDAACESIETLEEAELRVRVLSYDVRRSGVIPESPGPRFSLYLGTGGPGHIDPRRNDGEDDEAQGIREDPAWESPTYRLFDAIREDEGAALLGVCHTFGILCRWSGAAEPVLRSPAKGKCTGVLENILSEQAREHPWFRHFASRLGEDGRLRVVENRLFDLVPPDSGFPGDVLPIGWEALGIGGPRGEAVTMIELARDREGVMPRVFAVNHHPEIVDRFRQVMILSQKRERGEVSEQWYQERLDILTGSLPDEDVDRRLHLTSDFTLLGPLRFHLFRQIRGRVEARGHWTGLHEDRVLQAVSDVSVGVGRTAEAF
jgi:hypothetical protein